MKLLFDQNLSYKLPRRLVDAFPICHHVDDFALGAADDSIIWQFARDNGFIIVSKDADFHQRSLLLGHPPKVIWLRVGNCPTYTIESLLRQYKIAIYTFQADRQETFLSLA